MDVNINQLMDMTGKSFRTIKGRLSDAKLEPVRSDGRADYFDCTKALEAIYELSEKARENLKLIKANREKAEIEVGRLRGELLPIDNVASVLNKQLSNLRALVRALPSRLAKPAEMKPAHEVHSQASSLIEEFLSDLTADADYQLEADRIRSSREAMVQDGEGDVQANAETQPRGVGGSEPPTESGVE